MVDEDIFKRINSLSSEEEQLYGLAGDGSGLSNDERGRLDAINVELDRCYDLLHQRQGRRDAGQDPAQATARPPAIVEGYEQ
ncbi:MAG: DUF2630 family protein [Chloroflexi bacterium]|nr:DUF2630 family protein [Chloroflexota bacterium]